MKEIKLGQEARDKITGFRGIVTGKAYYMYGCTRYCMVPKVSKDGKTGESEWFDEGRIEIIGRGVLPKEVKGNKNGAEFNTDDPKGLK